MDQVWRDLPIDISEKICNFLPRVRSISSDLKDEIIKTQSMRHVIIKIGKLINWTDYNYQVIIFGILNFVISGEQWYSYEIPPETTIREVWFSMTQVDRDNVVGIVDDPAMFYRSTCIKCDNNSYIIPVDGRMRRYEEQDLILQVN